MAVDTLRVLDQPVGKDVSVETVNTINGVAVADRITERVILAQIVSYTGVGDAKRAQIEDVDMSALGGGTGSSATTNTTTTKVANPAAFAAVELIAAKAGTPRKSLRIVNDSTQDLLILETVDPGADDWSWKIPAGHGFEMIPPFNGSIRGKWIDDGSGVPNGKARVTEQW